MQCRPQKPTVDRLSPTTEPAADRPAHLDSGRLRRNLDGQPGPAAAAPHCQAGQARGPGLNFNASDRDSLASEKQPEKAAGQGNLIWSRHHVGSRANLKVGSGPPPLVNRFRGPTPSTRSRSRPGLKNEPLKRVAGLGTETTEERQRPVPGPGPPGFLGPETRSRLSPALPGSAHSA